MKCFVIMPFKEPFDSYYKKLLTPAIKDAGLKPIRADEIYGVKPIIDDITREIREAEVIIADVTGKNPNVNYELGLAHALGKQVIIVTRELEDVPFDYRQIRVINYNTEELDWQQDFQSDVSKTISSLMDDRSAHFILPEIKRAKTCHNLVEDWGIINIFETRQKMNARCDELYNKLVNTLDICAFGLTSFRDAKGKSIEEKVRNGLHIRILTPDPSSIYLKQRESDELNVEGNISFQISALAEWVKRLKKIAPVESNIQQKYYDSLPLDFYWHQEDSIFVGPYLQHKSSQQTISYEFKKGSRGYKYYQDYFDDLWENVKFCHEMT